MPWLCIKLQVTSVINDCLQSSPERVSLNDHIAFHILKKLWTKYPNFLLWYFYVGHLIWGLSGLGFFLGVVVLGGVGFVWFCFFK